ncbi:MAG: acetyltransferase [Betaproteobacteria bacterium]|nr:acetyltransferase [Betaproteobacteria bacterium]
MMHWDVFNGDADGLCALHQLRLCAPRRATLVTGVKRDIALLHRVAAGPGDSVTVLDVSLAANRAPLDALLGRGVAVQYFDHHFAGSPPSHPALELHIDTAPDTCTGLIVDRFLAGRQRLWAIVAAYGDALPGPASELAAQQGLDRSQVVALRELGEALAYNAYGEREADLVIAPAALYRTLSRHADPFACRQDEPVIARILATMRADLALARSVAPSLDLPSGALYVLPAAAWSHRVRGALGNELALASPERAYAILTPDGRGGFVVSVRAPRRAGTGADRLCRRYAGGGGRATAAGIDHLPGAELGRFEADFIAAFS